MRLFLSHRGIAVSANEASRRCWRAFGSVSRCERIGSTHDDPAITLCKFMCAWAEQHCGSPVIDGVCWKAGVIVMDDRLLILLREALLNTFLSLLHSGFPFYSTNNCFCVYPGSFLLPFVFLLLLRRQPGCFIVPPPHSSVLACAIFTVLCSHLFQHLIFTFRNTKGSSLYAGFSPLFITIRVRNSFRMVSVGSPYMSTSTYVPIFLSDKNCPEKTWSEKRTTLGIFLISWEEMVTDVVRNIKRKAYDSRLRLRNICTEYFFPWWKQGTRPERCSVQQWRHRPVSPRKGRTSCLTAAWSRALTGSWKTHM